MALDAGTLNVTVTVDNSDAKQKLNETEEQIKQNTQAAEEFKDNAGDLEKKAGGVFEGIGTKVIACKTKILAVVAAAKVAIDLAKKAIATLNETGQKADNLLTKSAQTGIDTETLQKWEYASRFIDTSVDTITGSMTRMKRTMLEAYNGSESAAEKFAALGVSVTDSSGALRQQEDIFWDALGALKKVGNETERDALAMEIFGRSAQELNPLIEAGRDAFEEYGDKAKRLGIIMNDQQLEVAGKYDDLRQSVQANWEGIKQNLSTAFMPLANVFLKLFEVITGVFAKISSVVSSTCNFIFGTIKSAFASVANVFSSLWNGIKSLFHGLFNGESLAEVGSNLVQGLKNGIVNAWHGLVDSVKSLGQSLLNSIKGVLGIASPSKITKQYGGFLVEGLSVGMDKEADTAVKTAKDVSKRVILDGIINQDVFGSLSYLPTVAGSSTDSHNQTIEVNVSQNNTYSGETANLMSQYNSNKRLSGMISGAIARAI